MQRRCVIVRGVDGDVRDREIVSGVLEKQIRRAGKKIEGRRSVERNRAQINREENPQQQDETSEPSESFLFWRVLYGHSA